MRAAYVGAFGADLGEVVAYAAATAHGFSGLRHSGVDAGFGAGGSGDGIAHGLNRSS